MSVLIRITFYLQQEEEEEELGNDEVVVVAIQRQSLGFLCSLVGK